jgi:hypothetical protein
MLLNAVGDIAAPYVLSRPLCSRVAITDWYPSVGRVQGFHDFPIFTTCYFQLVAEQKGTARIDVVVTD